MLFEKLKKMDQEGCVDPLLVKMLRETTSEPETTGWCTECSSRINYKIKVPQKFLQNPFLWFKWKVFRGEIN